MKKTRIIMLVTVMSILAIVATGCKSVNTNDGASAIATQAEPVKYEPVLELKNQKVSGEAEVHVLFGIFTWGQSTFADDTMLGDFSLFAPVAKAKSAAVYKTCKANQADTLLATKYEINTTDYFVYKKIDCQVAGYPATIKGVKKVDKTKK